MTKVTKRLVKDVISLALGESKAPKSKLVDKSKLDPILIHRKCRRWAHNRNVLKLEPGVKIKNEEVTEETCLRVWVREKLSKSELSRPVPQYLRDESFPPVRTDVVGLSNDFGLIDELDTDTISPGVACLTEESNGAVRSGVLGLLAEKNEYLIGITAGHLFFDAEEGRIDVLAETSDNNHESNIFPIGQVHLDNIHFQLGIVNPTDCASIDIFDSLENNVMAQPRGLPQITRVRSKTNLRTNEPIHMYSSRRKSTVTGRFRKLRPGDSREILIEGNRYQISDYIEILFGSSELPLPGDSGSLVVDSQGGAIGIYVAGVDAGNSRYVIPLSNVLSTVDATPLWTDSY